MEEDDFSQGFILPPLITQLRKILDQYPDDTQILKELIQNAEDAGARVIKFLYDKHTFGQDRTKLYNPGLARFQGPALYAYNDGLFNDDDWKGLRMLSDSVKQNDPFKVGYFGMGFKSVFHVTDLPSVLSGDKLGMIDPHQHVFPASSHGWNIRKCPDLLDSMRHQLDPYLGIFDCDEQTFRDGYYKGTMFRFPLRISPSPLSSQQYTQDKVHALFESFKSEAHLLLLFLRNLEKIEIYERDRYSAEPKLLTCIEISEDCLLNVRSKRMDFLHRTRNSDWLDKPIVSTYSMTIETRSFRVGYQDKNEMVTYRFLITNYYCGGQLSAAFSKLHKDTELNFLPWVGTAMPLTLVGSMENMYDMNDDDGHVFCFLPLPMEQNSSTGLPVHVNGFFALEQNRKHIKWPTSYKSREDLMDKRLLWNQCILKEALPKSYSEMILKAIQMNASYGDESGVTKEMIYRAFPDFSKVDRKWECVLPILYAELFKYPTVYTAAEGGKWIEPRHAIFNTLDKNEEAASIILDILTTGAVRIVDAPNHVLQAIKKCCHINLGQIIPTLVANTYRSVQWECSLPWHSKMKLLRYILQQPKLDLLDGLHLLPLANGGYDVFHYNPKKADRPIYIASSVEIHNLLPGLSDDFLDMDVEKDIKKHLIKAAQRGFTQLKVVDAALLGQLIPRCLPKSWQNSKGIVEWAPGEAGQPKDGWLELLWSYLVTNSPRDLSAVENLPLLPGRTLLVNVEGVNRLVKVIELFQLSHSKVSLARHMDGITLGFEIEEIAKKIGITVVDGLPDYIKMHPLITKNYIFSSSYIGVLRALERLCSTEGHDRIAERILNCTTAQEKRCLRELFAKISKYEMQPEYRDILSSLPIFETLDGSGGKESQFVSLADVNLAAPCEKAPFPLSRLLLDISSTESQTLARLLGIWQLNLVQLLTEVVFQDIENGFYDSVEVQKVMLYVLRHYHQFTEIDQNFHTILRSLAFLEKQDMLLTADRFYDPDHELLQKMFLFEEKFPSGSYSDPAIVAILREIGLRGLQDVEADDIRDSALCIQNLLMAEDVKLEKLVEKSTALLDYLQRHQGKLHADGCRTKLSEALLDIAWVKHLSYHPAFYPQSLSWYGDGRTFNKPSEMTSKRQTNLIGSVMWVVSVDVSTSIERAFGWDKTPLLENIIKHLANVVRSYDQREKVLYMELSRSIYSELLKHDLTEVKELLEKYVDKDWIWNGEGFVTPKRIVFIQPFMDLRPFVFSLPAEMALFSEFFASFGVARTCNLTDVLKMIREKHNGKQATLVQFTPLEVKRDLNVCVSILNELKSHITDEASLASLQNDLYLPVHVEKNCDVLKMAPLEECTYCDEEWIRQGYSYSDFGMNDDEHIALVHPNVPASTSEALGVPTLMSRMLDAEELDISFGQTDSLTHRLNTLLQEYSDGFAIPKELVQNADDAGATEVRFLYDERENEDARTCLIDEGMKDCQGPAIWVYNDAVFQDADFENITKLSGATKESQPDKIGRFGLGFNAVYNLTDVPSFVSRHSIVIFDPHTTHLGKSIKNKYKPGIRIDLRRHRKNLRRFGNQFKPYNEVFGCNLKPGSEVDFYGGTLFRFPLRTKGQALKSEICSKHYDDREVRELIKMVAKAGESLLLFTQNVIKISIYHLPKKGTYSRDLTEVFHLEKRPMRIIRELTPVSKLSAAAENLSEELQHFVGQCSTLKSSVEAMTLLKNGAKAEQVGLPDSSILIDLETYFTPKCDFALDPKTFKSKKQKWLICSYLGAGESLRMALQEENLLSTVGIAVPVEEVGDGGYKPVLLVDTSNPDLPSGSVFSYMPLPIRCGLPVHINGSFYVTSNRKYLCQQSEDDKFDLRPIWNNLLMRDAVCGVYIRMLADLAILSGSSEEYDFHVLWPNPNYIAPICDPLLKGFYKCITNKGGFSTPMLFSDGHCWKSIEKTLFLDFKYAPTDVGNVAGEVFRLCLSDTDDIVATLPSWMEEAFALSEVEGNITSNTYDIVRFFHEMFLPNISKVDCKRRDQLLLDALRRNDDHLNASMADRECIPVTPNGERTRIISELIDPTSSLAQLYVDDDERFPYGSDTYSSFEILQVLRSIGMKHALQHITWEDIIERAQAISLTTNQASARSMVTGLLAIMAEKLAEDDIKARRVPLRHIQEMLVVIPFLPVMKKPNLFPLPWKGEDIPLGSLLKPSDLYPSEYKDLICCVRPIADNTVFPSKFDCIQMFLKINANYKEPVVEEVLEQLDVIISPDSQNLLNSNAFDEIQRLSSKVCEFLRSKCGTTSERKLLKEDLQKKSFILAHNRFLSPNQVAFKFSHNCAPYLYSLPDYHKRNFSELLTVAGVKDQFDTQDYVHALQDLHSRHGTEELDRDLLKLTLQLVNLLNDRMAEQSQTLTEVVDKDGAIFIPDAKGVLRSASELCYNEPDCQWVPTSEFTSFSHALIPYAISKQLGVNTSRQEVLRKHSQGIPFGQRERLTNRIKRILSGYPCDKEILKELLQNADDAGATEISFIKDCRQHGTERVFDKSWRPLQGPAFCVYSNKAFTETDLEAIQQLGEGSKGTDPNKTGQYGVGFNCVYHLTDAPSFLTKGPDVGESLCIFDPHAKFVPGASKEEPGRRFQDVSRLRTIFTDIFSCYLEDKIDITNGTVFRFPLRDENMARESELSDQVVTLDTVDQLFAKFRMEMMDCLLFLNNITKISLTEIDKLTGKFINTYSISAMMSEEDAEARRNFSQYLNEMGARLKSGTIAFSDIPKRDLSYSITLTDTKGCWEKWLVSQSIGFEKQVEIHASILDAFRRKDLALMPRGGVSALLDSSDKIVAKRRAKKIFCFLPLPLKSELPVNINGHFALDHEARRNLWQDDDSGPKTEWNNLLLRKVIAPCYVVLLRLMSAGLSDSIAGSNVSLMDMPDGINVPGISSFCQLFPRLLKDSVNYWQTLSEAVYQRIHETQERVLPVVRKNNSLSILSESSLNVSDDSSVKHHAEVEWLSTEEQGILKPCFDNLDETFLESDDGSPLTRKPLTSTPNKSVRSEILRQVLLSSGFKLLHLPLDVYDSFSLAGVNVSYVTSSTVIDFYSSYKSKNSTCFVGNLPTHISTTPFKSVSTLKLVLQYCLQDSYYFYSNLSGLPLLLTEDEQLREFSLDNPTYLSLFHDLLPGMGHRFCHHIFSGSIFKECDVHVCPAFQHFDVESFARLLPDILSPKTFRTCDHLVVATEDLLPDNSWLSKVWRFLRHKYEQAMEENEGNDSGRYVAEMILKPLCDWNLLPAHVIAASSSSISGMAGSKLSLINESSANESSDEYLVPISMASMILDYSQAGIMSWPLRQCLRKLRVPELNCETLDSNTTSSMMSPLPKHCPSASGYSMSNNSAFAKLLVSTLEDPQTVLKAIHLAVQRDSIKVSLHRDECLILLRYFNDSLDSWKHSPDARTHLLGAPLHITVQGEVTLLTDHRIYLLHDDIPSCNLEVWQWRDGIIFLQANSALLKLYETLNCHTISICRLYLDFILKNFDYLTPEGRITHLEFLRDSYLNHASPDERMAVFQALNKLEFIPAFSEGSLHTVSEFYDPYHPVFKEMLADDPSAFPSAPFSEFKWLDFLRNIGLKDKVSIDMFVAFANEVAKEANSNQSEHTFDKSRTLVTHMFKMENLPNIGLLEQIIDIPFIPACKGKAMYHKIYPAFNSTGDVENSTKYIAFHEGVPEQHEVLIWTSAYLLPDWANPFKMTEHDVAISHGQSAKSFDLENYKMKVASMLRIQLNAPIQLVVSHMLKLCSKECLTDSTDDCEEFKAYLRMDIMKRVYHYLQSAIEGSKQAEELDDAVLHLAEAPCIVSELGQRFVKPKQVVIELYEEEQIIPYLYKAPTELGEFKGLFLRLGATTYATAEQYATVLESIHKNAGNEKLHPNELRLVFKAVSGLFASLQKLRVEDDHPDISRLYLPTEMGHLLEARNIIYNDEPSWAERTRNMTMPFLVNLAECKVMTDNYKEIIKLLPENLCPIMLSSIVKEVLDEKVLSTRELHSVAEKLRYQLSSKAFAHGMARLIKHEHRRSGHRVKQHLLEKMQTQLKGVHVFGVDRIITYLIHNSEKIPGSESECECFVDKTMHEDEEIETWNIYLHNTIKLEEEMQVSVADAVNKITGEQLKNCVHYIQPMLSCPPHSISKVLDRLKVRPDYHHGADLHSSALPVSGSFIPIEDHHLLKQDFAAFETGEYVGYELDDELSSEATIIYATVIKKFVGEDQKQQKTTDVNGVNGSNHNGMLSQEYLISVGDDREPISVTSTDLYKFQRLDRYISRFSVSDGETLSGAGSASKTPKISDRESFFEPEVELSSLIPKGEEVFCNGVHSENSNGVNSNGAIQKYSGVKSEQKARKKKKIVDKESQEIAVLDSNYQNSIDSDNSSSVSGENDMNGKEEITNDQEMENERESEETIMDEISNTLEEAWQLPEAQRRKIIKRLLLKWHPDKNLGDEELSTIITQHIYAEVERLELRLPRPKKFEEFRDQFDPRNPFAQSTTFQQNFYNAYQYFFEQMNRRAKEHKEQQERYRENFSREYSSTRFDFNCEVPPTFSSTNPQPAQAKRFFRQAQEDLKAADNDYTAEEPAFEWVCFKAHQAAEKALKAAQFHVDAVSSLSHDLVCLAASLEDIELRHLAQKLQGIVGNSNKLYNPDPIDFIVIPHEEYTRDMSCDAVSISQDILGKVKEIIEFKE